MGLAGHCLSLWLVDRLIPVTDGSGIEVRTLGSGRCLLQQRGRRHPTCSRGDSADRLSELAGELGREYSSSSRCMDLVDQTSERGLRVDGPQSDFDIVGHHLEDQDGCVQSVSEMILDCPDGVWMEGHVLSLLCLQQQ